MAHFKLIMGMIGGGANSVIEKIHRLVAEMGGMIELVAGVFSASEAGCHEAA